MKNLISYKLKYRTKEARLILQSGMIYFFYQYFGRHEHKHLRPMTLPHGTKRNAFPSLSPTTQPFLPSRPLFANTFTSLFHPPVAITSLKLHQL